MPKTEEYKDVFGKNRIRHTADNGNVTYASSQGYHNLKDMRSAAINAALEILDHYHEKMDEDQFGTLEALAGK